MNIFLKIFQNKKSFSIIETVLSVFLITILSISITVLLNLYKDYQTITPNSVAKSIIKKNHSDTLIALKQSILQAQNIVNSTTINGINYVTDSRNLILQTRSIDNNNNIISGNYDLIIFYTTSSNPIKLYQKIIPSSFSNRKNYEILINNIVKEINFEYNTTNPKDASIIKIYLKTSNNFSNKELEEASYIAVKLNK
ncbi:MAG: hypothetical protein NZ484_02085 [Patescibacteria group bacterium]|nr:hypothetical protein [Patescibacteria group bacterium]MDW8279651.1 hypothetical protein [bacterium]